MLISSYPFSCICSFNSFTTGLCGLDDMFHWYFLPSRQICFCPQLLVDSFFATNKHLFDSSSKVESELDEEFTEIFGFSPDADDAAVKAAFESGDMKKQMKQYMKLVNKKLPEILASEDTEEDTGVRDIDSDFQKELDAFDESHSISSASSERIGVSIASSDVWEPGFESMDVETFVSGPCIRCPPDATQMLLRITEVIENRYIRKFIGRDTACLEARGHIQPS